MTNTDLSGHLALVTGATGNLGRTIARTLARAGADMVVHTHRNRAFADELAAELAGLGRRTQVVTGDVGDPAAVAAMGEAIRSGLGMVDLVVANAVSQYAWKPVLEQPVADYLDQFRSCVLQAVNLAQVFLPPLVEAKRGGRFIAINTECAAQCGPTQSAYVAGKRGLDGVLRCLAREVGHAGITVNQVAPGWMIADRDRAAGVQATGYETGVPLGHRGEDRDVADAVAFLASDQARFITGVYLPVTGGNVMPGI